MARNPFLMCFTLKPCLLLPSSLSTHSSLELLSLPPSWQFPSEFLTLRLSVPPFTCLLFLSVLFSSSQIVRNPVPSFRNALPQICLSGALLVFVSCSFVFIISWDSGMHSHNKPSTISVPHPISLLHLSQLSSYSLPSHILHNPAHTLLSLYSDCSQEWWTLELGRYRR